MISQAQRVTPQEACGLLFGYKKGDFYQVLEVKPVKNELQSRTHFRMDASEQIQIFLKMDKLGLELVGIFHSHPCGPDYPSNTDIQEAYYPEAIFLILSPKVVGWEINGYIIQEHKAVQVKIELYNKD